MEEEYCHDKPGLAKRKEGRKNLAVEA